MDAGQRNHAGNSGRIFHIRKKRFSLQNIWTVASSTTLALLTSIEAPLLHKGTSLINYGHRVKSGAEESLFESQ